MPERNCRSGCHLLARRAAGSVSLHPIREDSLQYKNILCPHGEPPFPFRVDSLIN
mgnify:FL=1